MVWAIDNDDFGAECSSVRYPLLRAISSEFKMASGTTGDITTAAAPGDITTAATTDIDPPSAASSISAVSWHLFIVGVVIFKQLLLKL